MLVSKTQSNNVTSIFKNTKKTYLIVVSDEKLSNTKNWNIILQQQFNGQYLVLIKKVCLKCLLLKCI